MNDDDFFKVLKDMQLQQMSKCIESTLDGEISPRPPRTPGEELRLELAYYRRYELPARYPDAAEQYVVYGNHDDLTELRKRYKFIDEIRYWLELDMTDLEATLVKSLWRNFTGSFADLRATVETALAPLRKEMNR